VAENWRKRRSKKENRIYTREADVRGSYEMRPGEKTQYRREKHLNEYGSEQLGIGPVKGRRSTDMISGGDFQDQETINEGEGPAPVSGI